MRRVAKLAATAAALALTAVPAAQALSPSTDSAWVVQRQPPAGTCHARNRGLYALPDPHCTPGAVNPAVRQQTIYTTICRSGWTATVRPPEYVSEREKYASLRAYGYGSRVRRYEYDHLVPLELGGAVNDPRNLWPERDYPYAHGFYKNPKDLLENRLKRMVCDGTLSLARAQNLIASNWLAAYRKY